MSMAELGHVAVGHTASAGQWNHELWIAIAEIRRPSDPTVMM